MKEKNTSPNGNMKYVVTFHGEKRTDAELQSILAREGFTDIQILHSNILFDLYLLTLPDTPISGLAEAGKTWWRHYGCGGGDYSSEACATDACTSDIPRELACDIYSSIEGYSKTDFEASDLVQNMMDEMLTDFGVDKLEVRTNGA